MLSVWCGCGREHTRISDATNERGYSTELAVDDYAVSVTWEKVIYYPLVILAVNAASGIFLFLQRQGLIHSEAFADYAMADQVRPSLWGRIQALAMNHGIARQGIGKVFG